MNKLVSFRKIFLPCIMFFSLCGMVVTGTAFAEGSPYKTGSEPIAPGVVHESYGWSTNYGPILFEVLKCDLNNPNLDLQLVAGAGEYTKRATVSAMANRTNAVAMINGDFFNMALEGAPIGPSIVNGTLQSSPADIMGIYSLGIDGTNTAHIESMGYNGVVTAQDGATFKIDGLNKTYYWHDPSGAESHTNSIQLYNDFWGSASRGHSTNSEVLVNSNGIVEQISYGHTFPFEVPNNKYILQVNGTGEAFIKKHCPVGSTVAITSSVTPNRNWKFLVGGHALLADNGKMVNYTKDLNALAGIRARTCAAISKDGKTLWFICAEGRTNRSVGAQLSTLGYFMQYLGAYRGVNLDGGGSTAMIVQHLGENSKSLTVLPESYAAQRSVVNGIGVYNSTPEGNIAGFTISGPDTVVIGQTVQFSVTKAWDANYHPKNISDATYSYSNDEESMGAWSQNYFLALEPGTVTIRVTTDTGAQVTKKVTILGSEGLSSIWLESDSFTVSNGDTVKAALYGKTSSGTTLRLSPRIANWSLENFSGTVNLGTAKIDTTNNEANGKLVATVNNLRAEKLLGSNDYYLLDLYINKTTYWLNGQEHTLDQPPIIKNDRTLVPIRLITEALNGEVDWYKPERKVTVYYEGHTIELTLNSNVVTVDGIETTIDVPATVVNNRTLVPIRFISESLDMDVEYNGSTRCVSIIAHK